MKPVRTLLLIYICFSLLLSSCRNKAETTNLASEPGWAKEAIWYQIFVERFRNGDTLNDIRKNGDKSKYKDWYTILQYDDPATPQDEFRYEGWGGNNPWMLVFKEDIIPPNDKIMPFKYKQNISIKGQFQPELLKRKKRPDGIFTVNDLTAAAAMKIIKSHGLKVPDDISLVGFTSGMISDLTDPSLTSVEQHGYNVGKEAVRLLIDNLERSDVRPYQTKVINTMLVLKGSTRAI
jgi:hypothetical protein